MWEHLKKANYLNILYVIFLIENVTQITFIIKRTVHCNIELIIKKGSDKFLNTRLYMWYFARFSTIFTIKKRLKHPRRSVTFRVFFTFLKLYRWYQIAQNITYESRSVSRWSICQDKKTSHILTIKDTQ